MFRSKGSGYTVLGNVFAEKDEGFVARVLVQVTQIL